MPVLFLRLGAHRKLHLPLGHAFRATVGLLNGLQQFLDLTLHSSRRSHPTSGTNVASWSRRMQADTEMSGFDATLIPSHTQ